MTYWKRPEAQQSSTTKVSIQLECFVGITISFCIFCLWFRYGWTSGNTVESSIFRNQFISPFRYIVSSNIEQKRSPARYRRFIIDFLEIYCYIVNDWISKIASYSYDQFIQLKLRWISDENLFLCQIFSKRNFQLSTELLSCLPKNW